MSLNKIYELYDKWYYNSLTVDKGHYEVVRGSASLTYSNDGLTVRGTVSQDTYVKNNQIVLPDEYVAEITVVDLDTNVTTCDFCFEDWFLERSSTQCYTRRISSSSINLSSNLPQYQKGTVIKFIREGNSIKVYYNDTQLIVTNNNINTTHNQQFKTYNNRWFTIKDLKIDKL